MVFLEGIFKCNFWAILTALVKIEVWFYFSFFRSVWAEFLWQNKKYTSRRTDSLWCCSILSGKWQWWRQCGQLKIKHETFLHMITNNYTVASTGRKVTFSVASFHHRDSLSTSALYLTPCTVQSRMQHGRAVAVTAKMKYRDIKRPTARTWPDLAITHVEKETMAVALVSKPM